MKADWVVAGGKIGELGHCERCGEGLTINLPQRIEVVTAAMEGFVKAHSNCRPGGWKEPEIKTIAEWPSSRDTGVSSATIYFVMTGRAIYPHFDVPHDPSDFGRCYRLLKLAPEWRLRLDQVAWKFPEWGPFVRHWDELERMYEAALGKGSAPEMFDFMQRLEKEAR